LALDNSNFLNYFLRNQCNALFIRASAIFENAPKRPLCDYLEGAGIIGYVRAKEEA